jgi:hypothetical protein
MQVIWFVCTTLLLQTAHAPAASSAPLAQPNAAQQVAPAIQSSIQTNSQRLEGAELSLTRTMIDSSVKEETVIEEPLPNGGKVITRKVPQRTAFERVVVMEDRLRVDQGGAAQPAVTYWFDGVRWTESNKATRRVSKMHQNQIGGRTLDPREVAGLDYRTSLASILSQPALKEATVESIDSSTRITTSTGPEGQKLVVDFDSQRAMLPTRSQLFHPNGALARSVAITYAWIESRSAWALESITERIYEENVDGLATPDQWKQQMITLATCTLLDRDATEKLLAPVAPDGFQVVDYTDPATLQQRRPPRKPAVMATAESPLKWFIVAHLVVAAVAAVLYWRRRLASAV